MNNFVTSKNVWDADLYENQHNFVWQYGEELLKLLHRYFPSIGEYVTILETQGFNVIYATLFNRPTPLLTAYGVHTSASKVIKEGVVGSKKQWKIQSEYTRKQLREKHLETQD